MTDLDEALGQLPPGLRVDHGHACPDCPLGHPRPLCPTCLGVGQVTTGQLARWQARQDGA